MPVLLFSYPAEPLLAAPIPDAGSILRDQQNTLQQPKELPLRQEDKTQPSKAEEGIMVEVKGFTFSGYDGVTTVTDLQSIVDGAQGKKLSFGELNALTNKITAHLKEKGWSQARAYLPTQDITSGIIHIAITQGDLYLF